MEKRVSTDTARASNFTIAVIVFLIALALLFLALFALRQVRTRMERQELSLLAASTANKITKVITDRIWKAETLATLVVQGKGDIEDFDKIAAILVNDPAVLNVSLAPGGVVTKIFPYEENKAVIGLDYLNSGGKKEAEWAKETGKLTLAGPFTMIQGGQAVTGRLPVYLPEEGFWGFAGIALAYPAVLEAAYLDELFYKGVSGEIWRTNPDTNRKQVIWHSHDSEVSADASPNEMAESREVPLFNVIWNISVSRHSSAYSGLDWWMYVAGVVFLSLLTALLAYHYLELRHMKGVLENMAMTDTLTGLPNRRNVMQRLERAMGREDPFVVLYMDLNGFKQVNDTRGHDIGDMVLRKASEILRNGVAGRGMVARVGGDEFIVFLKNYTRSEKLDGLIKSLDDALLIPIPAEKGKSGFDVTASFGVSYFPEDGRDLTLLLHAADLRMYNTKKVKRDTAIFQGFKTHFR